MRKDYGHTVVDNIPYRNNTTNHYPEHIKLQHNILLHVEHNLLSGFNKNTAQFPKSTNLVSNNIDDLWAKANIRIRLGSLYKYVYTK